MVEGRKQGSNEARKEGNVLFNILLFLVILRRIGGRMFLFAVAVVN